MTTLSEEWQGGSCWPSIPMTVREVRWLAEQGISIDPRQSGVGPLYAPDRNIIQRLIARFTVRTLLCFRYNNWRGEDHLYIIEPEKIGVGTGNDNRGQLVLHGFIVTRDGDIRADMGSRRRTFIVANIRELKEIS